MSKPSFAAPRGVPPTIEQRPVADLMIDHSYQRDADRRLVDAIAQAWDWRLCAPLTVSRRGSPPQFFVIDGQHRLEAAKIRGDIQYLPCIISSFETVEEEAGLFVQVNRKRKAPTALETFRAELVAGDEKALQIHRVITEAGLQVAAHGNFLGWKPLQISSIQGVRGALFRHGEGVAAAALGDVAFAWPEEVLQYAGRILAGLYPLHANPPEGFEADLFRQMLAGRTHVAWHAAMLRRQARQGETPETAMHLALVGEYQAYRSRQRRAPAAPAVAAAPPARPASPPPPTVKKCSFEEQMARVGQGAQLVDNRPIHKADPETTGGSSANFVA